MTSANEVSGSRTGHRDPLPHDPLEVAEALRAEEFSDLPATLLAGVLQAERDHLDDRAAAPKAVSRVIELHLAAEGD